MARVAKVTDMTDNILYPCKNIGKLGVKSLVEHAKLKNQVPKLLQFTRFSWCKIWFEGFASCKRIDILQLCPWPQKILKTNPLKGIVQQFFSMAQISADKIQDPIPKT